MLINNILKSLNKYIISFGSFDKNDSIDDDDDDEDEEDDGIMACLSMLLRMTSNISIKKKE